MSIISENQTVNASVRLDSGVLALNFADEPAFTRSESVLVDLMQRSIGIIFDSAYHHIGDLPLECGDKDIKAMTSVVLMGFGEGGREIKLRAPIKIVRTNA